MMSKKHYKAIANMLAEVRGEYRLSTLTYEHVNPIALFGSVVHGLVNILLDDNPRFDVSRFLEAVYGKEGQKHE